MWFSYERFMGFIVEVCGSTRTRGYTRPDPYPRVWVGYGSMSYGSGRVAEMVDPHTPIS